MGTVDFIAQLQEDIDVVERMEYLLRWGGDMTGRDPASEIRSGLFQKSSFSLSILLLCMDDRAIARVRDRLFLQLYQSAWEREGEERLLMRTENMLEGEIAAIESKRKEG